MEPRPDSHDHVLPAEEVRARGAEHGAHSRGMALAMQVGMHAGERPSLWTLDVGNSRAKLRIWRTHLGAVRALELVAPAPSESSELHAGGVRIAQLLAVLAESVDLALVRGERPVVAYSCVAAAALEDQLVAMLGARLAPGALLSPESGLENLCQPPEAVGRDRLFAARGAIERVARGAIVVDVGSAVTVDAVVAPLDRSGGRAQFLGGAIAAGPALLASALHRFTARLPEVEVRPGAPAVGKNTSAAIEAGVFHGLRGAVRELVERALEELEQADLALVVTGGAAPWILDPPLFPGRVLVHDPDLVHSGLAHAALDVLEARSPEPRRT